MFRNGGWSGSILEIVAQTFLLGALVLGLATVPSWAQGKPKVRSITAFIRLDPKQYSQQIAETMTMLRNAKARIGLAGYEVQTVRITTQPFPEYTKGMAKPDILAFFKDFNALAKKEDILVGIGPAMMTDTDDPAEAQLLAEILAGNSQFRGSIVVAAEDGLHWKAAHAAAETVKYLEENTEHSIGTFYFAAIANVPAYAPFYPASYHQGLGHQFAIALESANVVAGVMAVQRDPEATRQVLISELGRHARAIQEIANKIDLETGWTYMGMDLSPAPRREVSIASALAGFTGSHFGASGTLTAAATITSALRDITVTKVGYSGLMLPVLEDTRLSQLWGEGAISMDQILAYSAVCGTGLDTIPLPGEVTTNQLERIIGDMASLSVKWNKPLSARLMPMNGAKAGDRTDYNDANLVDTVLQPLP